MPERGPDDPVLRFWSRVKKSDACWDWVGNSWTADGYGYISVKRRMIRAHRFSYALHYGPIPKGQFVCHKCDRPACVRPDHLFLGSPRDNVLDMYGKKRNRNPRGEQAPKARLTENQVIAIRGEHKDAGLSAKQIAALYGIKSCTVSNIQAGRVWKHLLKENKNG